MIFNVLITPFFLGCPKANTTEKTKESAKRTLALGYFGFTKRLEWVGRWKGGVAMGNTILAVFGVLYVVFAKTWDSPEKMAGVRLRVGGTYSNLTINISYF